MFTHVLLLFSVLCFGRSYEILGIFPHPGKSHFDVFEPLMEKLALRGHNVTVLSHFPRDRPMSGYTDVSLKGTSDILKSFIDLEDINKHSRTLKWFGAVPLSHFSGKACATLKSKVVQDLIKKPKKYDLILIEMWTTDCFLGLVHKFKVPFIGLSSCVIMPWLNDRFANPEHPAYVPVMFMDYSDDLSFLERAENTVMFVFNKIVHHFLFEMPGREAARAAIDVRMPPLSEIAQNASLFLVNTHFTYNRPRPMVPSVVEVGGMHLGRKVGKPLPQPHLKPPMKNYQDIGLDTYSSVYMEFIGIDNIPDSRLRYFQSVSLINIFAKESCNLLKTEKMQNLINTKEKFDLILIEMFNSDCFLGFVYKFNIPFIGLSSCNIMPWTGPRFANPINPAYIPIIFSQFSDNMNLLQKTENTLHVLWNSIFYKYTMMAMSDKVAREVFGKDMPHVSEIAENASLLLVNTHFSLNRPRPNVPSVIEVGGMFLKKEHGKIPQHIEKWINESTHGVIYFSMGSMIKGHSFPPEIRRAFVKAFARLPQRVLWKWENESLPEQPSNVMIQKWMPQFDILCHPNVKAYISHGGLLGTTEAVHCGVPMVVMPQYGDQFVNAAALEAGGGGVVLDFKEATEEKVYNALKKILETSFNKQAKDLSAAFKDRPMPPLDTAVYWVEYVARHNGAHHMRTKAVGMPWFQYLLLDVIAFLLVIFLTFMAILFYTLRAIFRLFSGKTEKIKTN